MPDHHSISDAGIELSDNTIARETLLAPELRRIEKIQHIWTQIDISTERVVARASRIESSDIDAFVDSLLQRSNEELRTILSIAKEEHRIVEEVIRWHEEESQRISSILSVLLRSIISLIKGKGEAFDYLQHERVCVTRLKQLELLQGMIRMSLKLRVIRDQEESVELYS